VLVEAASNQDKDKLAHLTAQLHTQTMQRQGVVLISVSLVLSRQWACARRYGW